MSVVMYYIHIKKADSGRNVESKESFSEFVAIVDIIDEK